MKKSWAFKFFAKNTSSVADSREKGGLPWGGKEVSDGVLVPERREKGSPWRTL